MTTDDAFDACARFAHWYEGVEYHAFDSLPCDARHGCRTAIVFEPDGPCSAPVGWRRLASFRISKSWREVVFGPVG